MDQYGDLQPAYLVAKQLGVSRQLVYWWTRSGKLRPVDTAHDGRPLYSMREALMVERETRRSPLSHRVA